MEARTNFHEGGGCLFWWEDLALASSLPAITRQGRVILDDGHSSQFGEGEKVQRKQTERRKVTW